jgi:hypothetical protein
MPWIYMFDEGGLDTKLGKASGHYHERFRDQQPCNPRLLTLRSAVWFDALAAMQDCENQLKNGRVFPLTDPSHPKREWYKVHWQDALRSNIWRAHGGQIKNVEHFKGKFRDDLNPGDVQNKFQLYAYVFEEEATSSWCKFRLSAYDWENARQTYLTGNPHNVLIHSRWTWKDNYAARQFAQSLFTKYGKDLIHFGWFRLAPAELASLIEQSAGQPAPRRPQESRLDRGGGRLPLS